jgi:hypothetical protein
VHLTIVRDKSVSVSEGGQGQVQAVCRAQGRVTSKREEQSLCLAVGG